MMTPGKRIRIPKWIHSGRCVVRVEVEGVLPDADPSEPCVEAPVVRWLDEVQRLVDAGDIDALAKIGDVYVRRSA